MRRISLAAHAPRHPLPSRGSRIFADGLPGARHAARVKIEVGDCPMGIARRSGMPSVHHGLSFTAALLGAAILEPRTTKPAVRRPRTPRARSRRAEETR